jgi:hypothetical protein
MKKTLAKCGCNCRNCPTYKENLKMVDDGKRCSLGWEKYLNIRLSPEKLRLCDGCNLPDKERRVFYLNCRVRKCSIRNSIENCAYCSVYPCDDVLNIHSIQKPNAREDIEKRIGARISQDDYLVFIEPYEGIKHLNEIRHSLKTRDIVAMIPVSVIPKIVPFPQDLHVNSEDKVAYLQIYKILSSLEISKNVPYARFCRLEKNRKQLLKLLWAFGKFGELQEERRSYLILDSKKYIAQKIISYHSEVQYYIQILRKYEIRCEIVPVKDKVWLTPGGALRKEGWFMQMSFTNNKDNSSIIKALKRYTMHLYENYGKTAFRYFSKVDMRVLTNT